ncbi:MAG: hypothetical protein ACRDTA_08845 [Pseudonocardiaceae bacterium]
MRTLPTAGRQVTRIERDAAMLRPPPRTDPYRRSSYRRSSGDSRQGRRFAIAPDVQVELLDRLLELNHERDAGEDRQGLDVKKSKCAHQRVRSGLRCSDRPELSGVGARIGA